MKLFSCDQCQQVVFFESVTCTQCGHGLAYLPDHGVVRAIGPDGDAGYRLCRNYTEHAACNWAVPEADDQEYCRSCRLNHIIPNLGEFAAKEAWHRLEIAKRRLIYTLLELELPVETKAENPESGLAFDFLQDPEPAEGPHVFTGHSNGLITINIAEADDPFREKMRVQMGEAYRTVLGHFRHEIGHYYWDRLIEDGQQLTAFRDLFGDETADYAAAQEHHYEAGPPADWPTHFVSAYASMHPWEDWAETWAHYLHIVDTLETARAHGMSLRPSRSESPPGAPTLASLRLDLHSFDDLITGWMPLTIALNDLNRSLGIPDGYPFVLSNTAVAKLRFIHDVIQHRQT